MENEQNSRVAKLWLGDDGIVRIIHVPGAEVTLKEIERGRGTAFDATAVDACSRLFTENRFAFLT